jgi:hypothetical protein
VCAVAVDQVREPRVCYVAPRGSRIGQCGLGRCLMRAAACGRSTAERAMLGVVGPREGVVGRPAA